MSTATHRPTVRWYAPALAVLVLALAAVTIAGPSGASLPAPHLSSPAALPAAGTLTPPVAALAADQPQRTIGVIVQVRPGAGDPAAIVARAGGHVTLALPMINAVAATVRAGLTPGLAATPGVKAVSLDASVRRTDAGNAARNLDGRGGPVPVQADGSADGTTPYQSSIRADKAWKSGITGAGVGVAVIDTGIAGDLPDFQGPGGASRVVANAVVPAGAGAGDGFGHGTHVAGLIGGANGTGTAPGANLVAVKVADDDGNVTLADVIAGLQFTVDHKDDLGIKVINLSLSSSVAESPATDPLDAAVEIAWFNGITVVAAAGNRGTDADAVSYAPANDPYVISVGAVDTQSTKHTSDDAPTSWSSRGTTQTGVAKPEVLAPGAHMVSTLAPGSDFATLCPACVVNGGYFRIGGTSMAAAVVSGAAADVAQANPSWTPDQIKGALMANLRDGVIDVDKAAKAKGDAVANQGAVQSTILPAYDPSAAGFDRYSWTRYSWTRYSWTRYSWTSATGGQQAAWSRYSWTCDCVAPQPADAPGDEQAPEAQTDRYSWTRYSWTRYSWTRYSWTRYSWTASFDK